MNRAIGFFVAAAITAAALTGEGFSTGGFDAGSFSTSGNLGNFAGAGDASSVLSNFSSISSGNFSFDNIPGLGNIQINCPSFSLDPKSICDLADQLNQSGGFSFQIGSCSIGASASTECGYESIKSTCQSAMGGIVDTLSSNAGVAGDAYATQRDGFTYTMKPEATAILANSATSVVGGEVMMKEDGSCKARFDGENEGFGWATGKTLEEMTASTSLQNYSFFDSEVNSVRECLEVSGASGVDQKTAEEGCRKKYNYRLPKNDEESSDSITNTAKNVLSSPSSGSPVALSTLQSDLEAAFKNNCSDASDKVNCEKQVIEDDQKVPEAREKQIASIETSEAMVLDTMVRAAVGRQSIVHFDSASINDLPPDLQRSYRDIATAQSKRMTVYKHFAARTSQLAKELSDLGFDRAEDAARPFYADAALKDIEDLLK